MEASDGLALFWAEIVIGGGHAVSRTPNAFLCGFLFFLAALMAASLLTTPATGQSLPSIITQPLACAPGQHYLPVTKGVADDFSPLGAEPTTPTPHFLAVTSWNSYPNNQYDAQVSGNRFADTIDLPLPANAEAMAVRITGRIRAADTNANMSTDTMEFRQILSNNTVGFGGLPYYLGNVSFSPNGLVVWNIDASNGIIPAPSSGSSTAQDVLDGISDNRFIDVQAQDDMSIDFFAIEICYESDQPDFEITKTLDSCAPGQMPDTSVCTYELEIRNHGGPYTGELQFTEILNLSTNSLDVVDASGAPVSCQYFTHNTSTILTFGSDPMSFDEQRLCTLPNVSIDPGPSPNEVIRLNVSAEIQTDQFHGPGSDRLNCASVVMWDGRPPLAQMQGNFPVHCIDAVPQGPCEIHLTASTPYTNVSVGDPVQIAFDVANEGGAACETVRMISYIGIADNPTMPTIWVTMDPQHMDDNISGYLAETWRSPQDWVTYMQDPAGGNVPNFQYSFPTTPQVGFGTGPGVPQGDLVWTHPARRASYQGPPVQSVAFHAGASDEYRSDDLGAVQRGAIICGLAVVSITDYHELRVALSLNSGIRPPALNSSTGNDQWADNINNAFAGQGHTGASCIGLNAQ